MIQVLLSSSSRPALIPKTSMTLPRQWVDLRSKEQNSTGNTAQSRTMKPKGRMHTLTAGRTLGGGSILDYGGWSRGDKADYNTWARLTSSQQWGYESLPSYFKRSEHFDTAVPAPPDVSQRGLSGPMKITSVNGSSQKRRYPLRKPLRMAWEELGVKSTTYGCIGRNEGLSEWLENWVNGKRRSAHLAYPVDGIKVLTNTPVTSALFAESRGELTTQPPKVKGVLLRNGQKVHARCEVVLCAGAIGSPTILMASSIGAKSILSDRRIPVVQELPEVGANMIDHFALFQLFKLRPSEKGLALGHSDLEDPSFLLGMPIDSVVNEGLPQDLLEKALDEDEITGTERDTLLEQGRCFLEYLVLYHPLSPAVPADGTYVSTSVMLKLPSSRGSLILANSPSALPIINPGYFASLHLDSSDAEIESRIRNAGTAHFHTVGTCAVGTVLDREMRVRGVQGLRVCDASVLPSPVGGHPQATLYGIGEMAAETITREIRPH